MNEEVTVPVEVEHTATVPVEAVTPEEPQIDPNALIAADVQIAHEEQETERARIAAKTAVKIAEISVEDQEWRTEMRAFCESLEARMTTLEATAMSLTPAVSVVTVETEAEPAPEPPVSEMNPVEEEVAPEEVETEAPAPARPRRRWI